MRVDGEVERGSGQGAARDALHLPGVLLEDQHVAGAEEGDSDRKVELGRGLPDYEIGVDERRQRGLRLALRRGQRGEHGEAECGARPEVSPARRHGLTSMSVGEGRRSSGHTDDGRGRFGGRAARKPHIERTKDQLDTDKGEMPMRRLILFAALAVLVVPTAVAKSSFPPTIALPNGFQPEGIAIGTGDTFYVGSIPTGAVYKGSLRTGKGAIVVPGVTDGSRGATGLEYDRGRLWVSGAGTGKAFVYSERTGMLLREYPFATPPGTFINDVVVTQKAAYFTDSQKPVLYRVAVSANGRPGAASTINLSGDYAHVAGQFNLNGIDANASGTWLLAVQSVTGKLFRIDPATGVTKLVDLGGRVLTNGDGILLHGQTLYVVQNRLNKIAVFRVSASLTQGSFVREITDSDFDVPTTIGLFGDWLYAVNARFGTAPSPTTTYAVVQVKR